MQNKLMSTILQSTYDAMIAIDKNEKIVLFNDAAEKLTGIKAKYALDKKIQEIVPNTRLPEVLHSGNAELYQAQNLQEIKILTNRVPVIADNGEIIAAVAVFRDISEMNNLIEQLASLDAIKTFMEAIIASVSDAISVVDADGKGILINPAYTTLTGLTAEDVINKPATVDIAEGESMHLRALRTKIPVKGAYMKVGPRRKEVVVNVSPIIIDAKLLGSVAVIRDISEIKRLTEELHHTKSLLNRVVAKYTFEDIIGHSLELKNVLSIAAQYAQTNATVLLRGESGTGKELFAHAIHQAGSRVGGQFIRVNCAALTQTLLESELFGYVEGAFTGARKGGKAGIFEEADGGTLFLDEIAELGVALQSKLLRVLQEKEIVRVGGNKPIAVDVRIITATNADLEVLMKNKFFREDLYYRLNMAPLFIPPLRQRREDLPELVGFLITKFNREFGRNITGVDDAVMNQLLAYRWPGNIRELENILGRAIINMHTGESVITYTHLPVIIDQPEGEEDIQPEGKTYEELFVVWEKRLLLRYMEVFKGNKTALSKALGISVRNLYYRLEKYNIQ